MTSDASERFSLSGRLAAEGAIPMIARSLTDTFAGIRPADVAGFITAQAAGAAVATALFRWLLPHEP
jgi:glycerol uptake facilitator-like aquaporin